MWAFFMALLLGQMSVSTVMEHRMKRRIALGCLWASP